ncbi:response regulator, partial [bacterium]|nr:response regulator [bacterium]
DDSHTTRILQKNILTNYGYNVSIATNPYNALEKVNQNIYDLIISDVQMPGMNGFEFITELRKLKNYETCPVIVVSSEPKENYSKEIKNTKIVTYIQKNLFKQEELIATIEHVLNQDSVPEI